MEKVNIGKARQNIALLIQKVVSSGKPVAIASRNEPSAILVPYRTHKNMFIDKPQYSGILATMFTCELLNGAPAHMIESQIKEFKELTPLQLVSFIDIDSFPIPKKKREGLVKAVGKKIVERLEKRREIADYISKATKDGLYEIEEHKTGMLDLS